MASCSKSTSLFAELNVVSDGQDFACRLEWEENVHERKDAATGYEWGLMVPQK